VDTDEPRICGEEFAMARRKRRSFTPEFKAEAVQLCLVGDRTIPQVAKDLDLTETTLRAWVREAEALPVSATPPLTSAEHDELKELRKRVKRLEMEREILKKAAAFFAKENT
jgi:transposase-like protein